MPTPRRTNLSDLSPEQLAELKADLAILANSQVEAKWNIAHATLTGMRMAWGIAAPFRNPLAVPEEVTVALIEAIAPICARHDFHVARLSNVFGSGSSPAQARKARLQAAIDTLRGEPRP